MKIIISCSLSVKTVLNAGDKFSFQHKNDLGSFSNRTASHLFFALSCLLLLSFVSLPTICLACLTERDSKLQAKKQIKRNHITAEL